MNSWPISLCYYPTTSLLVDDNEDFLKSMCLGLEKIPILSFSDPGKALIYLNYDYDNKTFIDRCTSQQEMEIDQLAFALDLRELHKNIYNSRRFAEVSVLVVDYAMPSMNGLEFCRKLNNKNIKKIMLTGEADKDLAITAFNEGIIDKFILKNANNLSETVYSAITELQHKYFLDLSKTVIKYFKQQKDLLQCLSSQEFNRLFNNIFNEHKIAEYYLLDQHGSFLLLDEYAEASWLLVKSKQDIDDLCLHAEIEHAPEMIVQAMKDKKKLPYFHTEHDLQTPPQLWESYLYPATKLTHENYYYAYVNKQQSSNIIDINKIQSFQSYLDIN